MLLTVKDGFVNILNYLYEEKLRLEGINTAHITLIPKKSSVPQDINFSPAKVHHKTHGK
jgi:hypothetical protein